LKRLFHRILLLIPALLAAGLLVAQRPGIIKDIGNRLPNAGNRGGGQPGGGDTLRRRDNNEDSITIRYYYLDSTRAFTFDSSIRDFTLRFPIPATHIYLGNTGTATRSLLFAPPARAGFDPGFHAFDVYKLTVEQARFYNTTRPYTELGYMLGARAEQMIDILHTQNIRPSFNASFRYRLINAPGVFKNQKTNHNNYLFTTWYQAPRKRYNNYFVLANNRLQASESGGIRNDQNYLDDPDFADDRFLIPAKIGGETQASRNPFNTILSTGNRYSEFTVFMRQQYDVGRKDSIVTDSTVIPLFYPRLRFEHNLRYGTYDYHFRDELADSTFYKDTYGITLRDRMDTLLLTDNWREITNDFSIYQFPDAKNLRQFIKAGIELQLLRGKFSGGDESLYNLMAHGEYRNRTRNAKWDMLGFGRLYINGYNAGDYHAYISLERSLGKRLGTLQAGFESINRSPSYIYNQQSSFYLDAPKDFGKENTTHLFARLRNDALRLRVGADYYLISNYLYLNGYYQLQQEGALFNVLRLSALRTFRLMKNLNWHAELYLQQKTGNAQVNFPALYTRNRVAYEGNFGFKNLNFSGGLEIRYHTPYNADNYSPVLGQFFYQDTVRISNLPDVHAFVHFRIKSFSAFARLENLNTARTLDGFGFTNNNLAAPDYPTPGMFLRFGIFWSFVN
jgi:hypothetical protein